MSSSVETAGGIKALDASLPDLPDISLPQAPAAGLLWRRGLTVAGILMTLFTLDVITVIFGDYWLFESLGLTKIFWTNFRDGRASSTSPHFSRSRRRSRFRPTPRREPADARAPLVQTAFLIASVAAYLAANELLRVPPGRAGVHLRLEGSRLQPGHRLLRLRPSQRLDCLEVPDLGERSRSSPPRSPAPTSARSRIPAALPPSRLRARVALSGDADDARSPGCSWGSSWPSASG